MKPEKNTDKSKFLILFTKYISLSTFFQPTVFVKIENKNNN